MRISDWSSDVCSSDLISLDSYDPARTLAYFQSYPPQTASGQHRYALALNAAGRREDANAAVRRAWTSGPLDDYETSRALSMFPGAITTADPDARMDNLLWHGATAAAKPHVASTSPATPPPFPPLPPLPHRAVHILGQK